mgnify:FL=1
MLNVVYRLTRPRKFEVKFTECDASCANPVIRPLALSICNADQRYYRGKRPPEILAAKLPMALIHEACGTVVYAGGSSFTPGSTVVMIPNTPCDTDPYIAENYLRSSRFRASGFDGFMQDLISMPEDRIVAAPAGIDTDILAFTEFVSVGYHAVTRMTVMSHGRRERIGIWGDGNLAFVVALIVKHMLPETKIVIFGVNEDKLDKFTFADETYLTTGVPADVTFDHAFECVGGEGSPKAINRIIDLIKPEGTISILGVSENPVPINTRMILEKGLRMFGSSRSGREDFDGVMRLYREHPEVPDFLSSIVGDVVDVRSCDDMVKAFELDIRKYHGKTIMHWNV